MQAQIIPIVGAAIAGLLPIVLTAVISWLDKRSILARRSQALSLAQQRIEFLSAWIKAQESLCSIERFEEVKRAVSDELMQLREHLNDILDDEHNQSRETVGDKQFLQKLFLIYIPRNVAGWVFHTLFYMSLSVTVIVVLLTLTSTERNVIGTVVACADIPSVVAVLAFHYLATMADRKADQELATRLAKETAK
jgi:hypothetical protein